MLIVIPKETTEKVTQKNRLKETREVKWNTRKYLTQKESSSRKTRTKSERHIDNKQQNDRCKSYLLAITLSVNKHCSQKIEIWQIFKNQFKKPKLIQLYDIFIINDINRLKEKEQKWYIIQTITARDLE